MKMSGSIKDYKQAMDNIRISGSFYAKTEALLKELPEAGGKPSRNTAKIRMYEKRTVHAGRKITAVLMSAAACAVFVFGVRLALENGRQDISVDTANTATETAGSYDSMTSEAEADAADLIDRMEDNDFPVDITPDDLPDVSEDTQAAETEPTGASEAVTSVTEGTKPPKSDTSVTEGTKPPKTVKSVTSAADNEKDNAAAAGSDTSANGKNSDGSGKGNELQSADAALMGTTEKNTPSYDYEENDYEEPDDASDDIADDAAGYEYPDGDDSDVVDDSEEIKDKDNGYEDDEAISEPEEPLFVLPAYEDITLTVAGNDGTAVKKGTECKTLADIIAGLCDSPETRDGEFTPLFTVNITDNASGLTLYTVYLTDMDTLVISRGDGGSVQRKAFALSVESSEELKDMLQNMF